MTAPKLVLSLFPGIGLLDRAFEEAGFCVVRGPDLLWGGDVRAFHPPAGVFDGVIGGPPCQAFSAMRHLVRAVHGEDSIAANLIPEYERVVRDARPRWFVMENVPDAPLPVVDGYELHAQLLRDVWVGGETMRLRRISFGTHDGRRLGIEQLALHSPEPLVAALANGGNRLVPVKLGGSGKEKKSLTSHQGGPRSVLERGGGGSSDISDVLRQQGLPSDFLADAPFTSQGKRKAIGNGVPLPMGRAIARAVLAAIYGETTQAGAA